VLLIVIAACLAPPAVRRPECNANQSNANANKSVVCTATQDEKNICHRSSIKSDSVSTLALYVESIRNAKKTMFVFDFSLSCYTQMRFKLLPTFKLDAAVAGVRAATSI
jgi:hypothetical protein